MNLCLEINLIFDNDFLLTSCLLWFPVGGAVHGDSSPFPRSLDVPGLHGKLWRGEFRGLRGHHSQAGSPAGLAGTEGIETVLHLAPVLATVGTGHVLDDKKSGGQNLDSRTVLVNMTQFYFVDFLH